jgi:hypothetical protein
MSALVELADGEKDKEIKKLQHLFAASGDCRAIRGHEYAHPWQRVGFFAFTPF